jgi:hypothetical protein
LINAADGVTSLREAVFAANQTSGADEIDFDPALTVGGPATILLTQGELKITGDLAINGASANLLSIQAFDPTAGDMNGDGSRIFNIDDGASTARAVSITGLTLTGADVLIEGGAIFSKENLTVAACAITANHADASGGAIYHDGASLLLNDSTISGNKSFSYSGGGAIASQGDKSVNRTTISGNSAGGSGGGIWHQGGALEFTDCTIASNQTCISTTFTSDGGGGMWSVGSLTLRHTIVAGNNRGPALENNYITGSVAASSACSASTARPLSIAAVFLRTSSARPRRPSICSSAR